jgi:hypothetical protein
MTTLPTLILHSTTAGHTPASLVAGQIGINEADQKLYYRTGNGSVVTQFLNSMMDTGINTVLRTGYFEHRLTSGTPAVGIGVGLYFGVQTQSTLVIKNGGAIDCVSTNVTASSEAFDLVLSNMSANSLREVARLDSNGTWRLSATPVVSVGQGATIDTSGMTGITVTSGASSNTGISSGNGGLFIVTETSTNETGLYVSSINGGGGPTFLGTSSQNIWVACTSTPAAGKCTMNVNGSNQLAIYNNIGSSKTFKWNFLRTS